MAPVDRFMVKNGYANYPAGPELERAAECQFMRLARMVFLRGLPLDEFVVELAEIWGELNVIHPFQEGNTRTQFVFFSQLCEHAGYHLDPSLFARDQSFKDESVRARFHSQASGSNARLAKVLRRAIS